MMHGGTQTVRFWGYNMAASGGVNHWSKVTAAGVNHWSTVAAACK